ncbi:MAG: hypothetical protein ACK4VI_06560 [Alphaproteobacteria bacterium]
MTAPQTKRARDLVLLGRFLVQEYNYKTGICSYDPEGFRQDVLTELDRIFEPEISAIRDMAQRERDALASTELRILKLEFELAVANSLNRAYERIIELQASIYSDIDNRATIAEEFATETRQDSQASLDKFDASLNAFSKAAYERSRRLEQENEHFLHRLGVQLDALLNGRSI